MRPAFVLGTFALVALGVGLACVLPCEPRWTLDVDEQVGDVSPDGESFFTIVPSRDHQQFGPLRLRDSRTGREIRAFFTAGERLLRLTVSGNRRFCAAIVEPDQVRVVDLQEQRSWSLPAPDVNADYALHFAADGGMIHVRAAHVRLPERNFLFELPAGRLFAPAESIKEAQFSPDGRYLVTVQADGTHLWNRATREKVGEYRTQHAFRFSRAGPRLVTSPESGEKEPFRPVLWDLNTHRRVADLPVAAPADPDCRYVHCTFAPDGRWLVTWHEFERDGQTLEVWDSADGRRLARHQLDPDHRRSLVLSPDSSALVVIEWFDLGMQYSQGDFALSLLDMPSGRVRWQRRFAREETPLEWNGPMGAPGIRPEDIRFTADSRRLGTFAARQGEWRFLDAQTGESLPSTRLFDAGTSCFHLDQSALSPGDRALVVSASVHVPPPRFFPAWAQRWWPHRLRWETLTLVLDSATGAELGRVRLPGSVRSVSSAGDLLVTDRSLDDDFTHSHRLQGWSVPSGRPWRSIIGIPVALGLLALALRRAARENRRLNPLQRLVPG